MATKKALHAYLDKLATGSISISKLAVSIKSPIPKSNPATYMVNQLLLTSRSYNESTSHLTIHQLFAILIYTISQDIHKEIDQCLGIIIKVAMHIKKY